VAIKFLFVFFAPDFIRSGQDTVWDFGRVCQFGRFLGILLIFGKCWDCHCLIPKEKSLKQASKLAKFRHRDWNQGAVGVQDLTNDFIAGESCIGAFVCMPFFMQSFSFPHHTNEFHFSFFVGLQVGAGRSI